MVALVSVATVGCSSGESLPEGVPQPQEPGEDWREVVTYGSRGISLEPATMFAITVPPHWIYEPKRGFNTTPNHLGPGIPGDYTPGHLNFYFAENANPVVPVDERESLIRWDWKLDPAIEGDLFVPPDWNGYVGADLVLPSIGERKSSLFIAGPVENEASGMMLLTALRSIRPCFPESDVEPCQLPSDAG